MNLDVCDLRVSSRRRSDVNAQAERDAGRWLDCAVALGGGADQARRLGTDPRAGVARSARPVAGRSGLGVAAFTAFLLRTPAKLIAVDVRRGRWLDRTRLARRVVIAETVVLAIAVALTVVLAGWSWLVPVVIAGPLVAVEFWFDIRSRGRRLIPELCGAMGSPLSLHRS